MKKILLSLMFVFGATFAANAQSSGDMFVGGSSNLGLTITPDFALNAAVTADYFVMDGLSVGANVGLGIGAATTITLAPKVSYFVTDEIFAMVNADVLAIAGGNTSVGLNALNAGVGYWYSLSDNVVVAPMVNLNNVTNSLSIGAGMGITVKL
ncbi:MAG: hypothetical protein VXY91_02140 [Bacteroidota bacterium]|nr:hypothetical protein [Bacteroidota bacterium]